MRQKNIVIFGATDFGRLMQYYFKKDDPAREVVAFTNDRAYMTSQKYCGLPLIPFEELSAHYPPDGFDVLIAIGNKHMGDIRKSIFQKLKQNGYCIASFIHSSCSIHSEDLGEGNILLENCLVYPFAKIGSGNLLWDHVLISHDCVVGDFNTFSSYADLCGYVTIGSNGYYGKHCVIQEHADIADYTLIGANALAKGKTQPYQVVVPARSVVLEHKISTDLM